MLGQRHECLALNAMAPSVPAPLVPVLESTAIAFISTIGPNGAPQTTPQWFLWEHDVLHFSLVEGLAEASQPAP